MQPPLRPSPLDPIVRKVDGSIGTDGPHLEPGPSGLNAGGEGEGAVGYRVEQGADRWMCLRLWENSAASSPRTAHGPWGHLEPSVVWEPRARVDLLGVSEAPLEEVTFEQGLVGWIGVWE